VPDIHRENSTHRIWLLTNNRHQPLTGKNLCSHACYTWRGYGVDKGLQLFEQDAQLSPREGIAWFCVVTHSDIYMIMPVIRSLFANISKSIVKAVCY